ncbi:MAG TPA: sigma-70 family RNA polymerase sigma factor [Blastocatellia bacterium]|nr:sigma-70 family RNA polymerase sigma factor [Blastocatellia bacterium]
MAKTSTSLIEHLFAEHERFLWGIGYRMTGNAADADDLVQETFVRAMNHPPAKLDEPLRPWLVQVTMNLSRDLLRRRKRQAYEGIWLPSPIETAEEFSSTPGQFADQHDASARYDLLESVSFAFLLALEALTPSQRAVLLLRDVFDYSVNETAEALNISEPNVKTTHHRARKAMSDYDHTRVIPTRELQAQTRQTMEKFLLFLANHDVAGVENLLAGDVRQLSDGGGEFLAARKPVIGREKVALFNLRVTQLAKLSEIRVHWQMLNGLPALVTEYPQAPSNYARRIVTFVELNTEARIKRIYNVLATRKLALLNENHAFVCVTT